MELALKQGTPEWLAMRKKHIMASDAPVVMGVSPWRTPLQLWKEKIGIGEAQKENAAMKYGKENEHKARIAYKADTGYDVYPKVIFHHERKFMGASLDGWTPKGNMAVEIKCPGLADHNTAKEGKVPEKYIPQLQHQLACLDCSKIHYYSFRNNEGVLVEVEYDEKYIDNLYQQEALFWDKVLNLNAPDLLDKDYKDMDSSRVWKDTADQWSQAKEELKLLEEKEKGFRKTLILLAEGQSSRGHGIRLMRIPRKGSVDYKTIPELIGINLEQYRKKPTETWRLDITLKM